MLRQLIRRLGGTTPGPAAQPRLFPAVEVVRRFRAAAGGKGSALALTRGQLHALRELVATDAGWSRVCELVARAGDPWNADDWPEGFDPLMLCAALCDDVAFECVRCPVGQRQQGSSCAHPQSLFGYVLTLVARGDRSRLLVHLDDIDAVLDGTSRWDMAAMRRCE